MTRSGAVNRKARAARREAAQAAAELDVEYDEVEEGLEDFEHFDADDELDVFDALDRDELDHAPFADDDAYPDLPACEQEALRNELQDRLGAYLSHGRARVVITDNLRTMMSIKRELVSSPGSRADHGLYTFRLHHMFVDASPVILRAAAAYAERQDRAASELLREFIDQNDDAIRRSRTPRACTLDVEGRHHNLQQIFDELNREYFGGAIRARITWGPRARRKRGRASIKLGSYTVEDELIRVHPVLDAEDVPRYYLAWVIYHEMLHEIHDMPVVDGRRIYHTRAFRQAEAKFEHYAEAVLWERTNLHKLLDR